MAKTYKQKPGNGKVTVDLPGGAYLISEETTDNGVIVLTCTPTNEQKKGISKPIGFDSGGIE